MKRCEKVGYEAVRDAVTPHGCTAVFGHGGKHAHVVVTAPDGQWAKITLSSSPRAGLVEVANWCRQDAVRALRGFGVVVGDRAPAPARRAHVTRQPKREVLRFEPHDHSRLASDPWAALRGLAGGAR